MKKIIFVLFATFSIFTHASSATSTTLRTFSKAIKIAKVTPHPVIIIGGFALAIIVDCVADIIDDANADTEDTDYLDPEKIKKQNDLLEYKKSLEYEQGYSSTQTRAEEVDEESDKELPTVVIVHGFVSSDKFHSPVISPLTKQLIERGFPVYIAKISKIKFAYQQADLLHEEIKQFIPAEKEIILIGHSLGGIISRQYAFNHHKERVIKNVISIGTPHWGVDHNSRLSFIAMNKALSAYKELGSKLASKILETTQFLSEEYMAGTFNYEITNAPGVDYLSTMTIDSSFSKAKRSEPVESKPYRKALDSFDEHISDALITVRTSMWTKMLYADKCVYPVNYIREIRGPLYEANHITQVSTLNEALSLKSNAYRLGKDIVNYITATIHGGKYINPPHCDPF